MCRIISGNSDSTSTVGNSESFDRQLHASMPSHSKWQTCSEPCVSCYTRGTNSSVKRSANSTMQDARCKMQDARCKMQDAR
ncbi:hypothetical protein GE21DRAFT_1176582, partial [Neurospora crassa]